MYFNLKLYKNTDSELTKKRANSKIKVPLRQQEKKEPDLAQKRQLWQPCVQYTLRRCYDFFLLRLSVIPLLGEEKCTLTQCKHRNVLVPTTALESPCIQTHFRIKWHITADGSPR